KHFYSIRAARKLDSDRFDLIHAHRDSGVGLFLYSHSIPVVWTLPGTIAGMVSKAEGYSSVKNYIRPSKHILSEYLAARACDYAVACSETVKDEAVQYYGMDAGDIRVIPYGIDVDKFDLYPRGEAVEKLDLEENSKYMIWVGLNTERKGLPTAVETAKRLDGVRLLVVGADGADSNDVKYFGEVPNADLPLYFAAADVFLFPTH
ncbi:MAG: glycosyltransferase family 4 protein, partial [Candidatus Aenigmatarchaeota archaeon]